MRFAKFVRGGYGVCAAAALTLVGFLGAGGSAAAQTVYEGKLTAAEKADAVAWSTLYWQRVDQGGGSPGTGFAFTSAAMQSQLFNLLRGGRSTLVSVGKFGADACDQMAQPELPAGSAEITGIRTAYRDLMLYGEIATNIYQNPGGTIQHANLILSTPPGFGVGVYIGGNDLVSVNLPLKDVDAPAYAATLAMNTSQETQDAISAMISSGATWAGLSGTVTQAKKHITGQASRADNFADLARGYLSVVGMSSTSVEVISAQFGVYGELPVVAVQLGDALVLMDPVNGNLSGPFTPDSKLDATGLLSVYPSIYVAGTSVGYYTAAGCPTTVAAGWKDSPQLPGPWGPRLPAPGTPIPPILIPGYTPGTQPSFHPDRPGWFTDWDCVAGPGSGGPSGTTTCICSSYGWYDETTPGATGKYMVQRQCALNYPCSAMPGSPTGPIAPGTPQVPGVVPTPPTSTPGSQFPGAAWSCDQPNPTGSNPGIKWYY